VTEAVSLEALSALSLEERRALLCPVDCLVRDLPALHIDGVTAKALKHGQSPSIGSVSPSDQVYRILEEDRFIGLARMDVGQKLKVVRMMATAGASV
jgi:tRNA U55 pseudouridine synthase TruB